MKRVTKKKAHYSMVVMRNEVITKTYRAKGITLKFLLTAFVLFCVAGGASIAGTVYLWDKYHFMKADYKQQKIALSEMRLKLEKLENFKSLLAVKNDPAPMPKNEEIGASAPITHNATVAPLTNSTGLVLANVNATAANSVIATHVPGTAPATQTNGTAQTNSSVGQTNSTLPQTNSTVPVEASQPKFIQVSSDASPVRITDFNSVQGGSPPRLMVNYDLSVSDLPQKALSGFCRYEAEFLDGKRMAVTLYSNKNSFTISRRKKMGASIRIPEGYTPKDIAKVFILVDIENDVIYEDAQDVSGR